VVHPEETKMRTFLKLSMALASVGIMGWSQIAAAQSATTVQTTGTDTPTSSTTTTTTSPAPTTTTTPTNTTVNVQQPAPTTAPTTVGTTQTTSAPFLATSQRDETVDKNVYYPNTPMIVTGAIVFGAPWAASAIVSGESNHQGDNHLWIPIAGPWMDFADRGNVPQGSGHDGEIANRVFLAADGVVQAIGVLQIASGLLFPVSHDEKKVTTVEQTAERNRLHVNVTPMQLSRDGYGLAALGTF
jgi:hypothetical protein